MPPRQANALATKLAALKQKSVTLTVEDIPVPPSSADFLSLFKQNSSAKTDQSNEWIIDLFPNMVPILCYVLQLSSVHANLLDFRNHAKLSVATVTFYHMTVVYAFFLINDLYVRPSPSVHARSWSNVSNKHDFVQFLLTLPVPEELETILTQLVATETDRTANVFIVPSAAGFAHRHHFGRFFPLTMFTTIHDTTAELPGNTPRIDVLKALFSPSLYECRTSKESTSIDFKCRIPDVLGIALPAPSTEAQFWNSKLYQVFNSTFNPVLFRDYQRRSSLASVSLSTPKFNTADPNAYDLLFGYTPSNLRESKVILQAVSSLFKGKVSTKKTLSDFIATATGINALDHGYSTFALPTFCSNPDVSFDLLTKLNRVDESEYAQTITFLQQPAASLTPTHDIPPLTTVKKDTDTEASTTHKVSGITYPFDLRSPAIVPSIPQHDKDFVLFDETQNVYPRVLVLDVSANETVSAHLATLSGKIIESFELDGTTIEIPNIDKPLGVQNSLFADSAIPLKYVIAALAFRPRSSTALVPPRKRADPLRQTRVPASSLLLDRTKIVLPSFTPQVIDTITITGIPGFANSIVTNWVRQAQRFIGFHTADYRSLNPNDDSVPYQGKRKFYVWSPYSYTSVEDEDDSTNSPAHSRTYFLTNLRTIFGTDVNMVQVTHPLEAIPVL